MATLKGIFPNPKQPSRKNFIQENVKNLRRMEQYFHSNKDIEDFQKLRISKQQHKFQNVGPRVNSSLQGSHTPHEDNNSINIVEKNGNERLVRNTSVPTLTHIGAENKKVVSKNRAGVIVNNGKMKKPERGIRNFKNNDNDPNSHIPSIETCDNEYIPKFRSQGIQTLDANDGADVYAEGIIRYPSARTSKKGLPKLDLEEFEGSENLNLSFPSARGDACCHQSQNPRKRIDHSPTKENVDYVRMNKEKISVATKMAEKLNNSKLPNSYRKGVVPKYIKERREEQLQKEIKAQEEAILIADCPEGHIPLPDNERRETLRLLKKNYQEFVNKLNMIPIRSDTLRSQRQKIEIEKELNKLEEGIKVFSRPKVFVKINA